MRNYKIKSRQLFIWILTIFCVENSIIVQAANTNRFSNPSNLAISPWVASNLSVTSSMLSVPTNIDADGYLDQLISTGSSNGMLYSVFTIDNGETVTPSIALAGSGTVTVSLNPLIGGSVGSPYRLKTVVLSSQPKRINFVDFTKPADGKSVALVISGVGSTTTVYAGGANARSINLVQDPDNFSKASWIHSGNLQINPIGTTPLALSRQDDSDGALDVLKANADFQSIYAPLSMSDGQSATVSLVVAGSGTIGISISPIENNPQGIPYGGTSKTITLSAVPQRIKIPQLTKPNDGKTAALLISNIDSAETVYIGGVRAYINRFANPNSLNISPWVKSVNLTVTAQAQAIPDGDGNFYSLSPGTFNSQNIYSPLTLADGETASVSIYLKGTGTIAISISPIENNTGAYTTPKMITLTPAGARYTIDYFTKPADGRTAAFLISGIDSYETVYAGGARAYHPVTIFDEDYSELNDLLDRTKIISGSACQSSYMQASNSNVGYPRWVCLQGKNFSSTQSTSSGDSIQLVSAPGGRSGKALKFFTNWNDYFLNNTVRTEVASPILNGDPFAGATKTGTLGFELNKTYYIKTSYFIPSDQVFEALHGEISWQVHQPCDDGHAPFEQFFSTNASGTTTTWWDKYYDLMARSKDVSTGYCNPTYAANPSIAGGSPNSIGFTQGQWVDLEVIWRPDNRDSTNGNNGKVTIRRNGVEVYGPLLNVPNSYANSDDAVNGTVGMLGFPHAPIAGYLKEGTYRYDLNPTSPSPGQVNRTIYYGPTLVTVDYGPDELNASN